jgi:hypothetical protein
MRKSALPLGFKVGKKETFDQEYTLVRIVNHGLLEGSTEPFIETVCKGADGMYYIGDIGMRPVSEGRNSIEELAEKHGRSGFTEHNDLQKLAIELYCKNGIADKFKESFIKSIDEGTPVFDMRDKGFYCSYCNRYAENSQMGSGISVIFAFNGIFEKEQMQIWIIKGHYDGCRGWD